MALLKFVELFCTVVASHFVGGAEPLYSAPPFCKNDYFIQIFRARRLFALALPVML